MKDKGAYSIKGKGMKQSKEKAKVTKPKLHKPLKAKPSVLRKKATKDQTRTLKKQLGEVREKEKALKKKINQKLNVEEFSSEESESNDSESFNEAESDSSPITRNRASLEKQIKLQKKAKNKRYESRETFQDSDIEESSDSREDNIEIEVQPRLLKRFKKGHSNTPAKKRPRKQIEESSPPSPKDYGSDDDMDSNEAVEFEDKRSPRKDSPTSSKENKIKPKQRTSNIRLRSQDTSDDEMEKLEDIEFDEVNSEGEYDTTFPDNSPIKRFSLTQKVHGSLFPIKPNVCGPPFVIAHEERELAVVVMEHPSEFYITGFCKIFPMVGGLHINGSELTADSSKEYILYGFPKMDLLPIKTLSKTASDSLGASLSKLKIESLLPKLSAEITTNSVVFALKRHSNVPLEFTCDLHDIKMNGSVKMKNAIKSPPLQALGLSLYTNDCNFNLLQLDQIYKEILDSILNTASLERNILAPVVLVCGGFINGKSTTLRFLVNGFLNKYDHVCYLDLDTKQPEFTAPGIMSLIKVSNPLLGPAFSHSQTTEKSIFVGNTNLSQSVYFYHEAMLKLVNHYTTNFPRIPLFINTMGSTRGKGYQLLIDAIRYIQPTHLIQMIANVEYESQVADNFEKELTAENVNSEEGLISKAAPLEIDFTHYNLQVNFKRKQKDPLLTKEISLTSHLEGFNYSQKAKFIDLAVCFASPSNYYPTDSDILSILRCGLVAFCRIDEELIKQQEDANSDSFFTVFPRFPINEFLGFGVVRNFNFDTKEYYFRTNRPDENFCKVNAIFYCGGIQTPLAFKVFTYRNGILPFCKRNMPDVKLALSSKMKKKGFRARKKN